MSRLRLLARLAAPAAATLVALVLPGVAAALPTNDDFASATAVSTLPFSDSVDLDGAGTEPGEQQWCDFRPQTVWYSLTVPRSTIVRADVGGSDWGVGLTVYRAFGPGLSDLGFVGCTSFGGSHTFTAEQGFTYYVQAGSIWVGPAQLRLALTAVPPPANDDWANAAEIASLPYHDDVETIAATTEAGEPLFPTSGFGQMRASVWYRFTPDEDVSVTARPESSFSTPVLTVYTGDSLSSLQEIVSRTWWQPVTFRASAGRTYHLQLGRGDAWDRIAPMSLQVDVAPPPQASFFAWPHEPSVYDTVQFSNTSFDPAGVGIVSLEWDLGDGTTASGCCPSRRYATDGDYTVGLTVGTADGRTASTSQVLNVRTHDVEVTRLQVPESASTGQTRSISVGVRSLRYAETVQVLLYKSAPTAWDGFELVGTLTQWVPPRSGNRTVPFDFSYTFTAEDAAVGKVTFKAVASIVGARDAQLADNTLIGTPTSVRR